MQAASGAGTDGSTCISCHSKQALYPRTAMARALDPPGLHSILEAHPKLAFQEGAYSYRIERHEKESVYTVTDGKDTLSLPVRWALGANSQTYVLEYGGRLYESRVSYYQAIDGLDITLGDQAVHPRTMVEAMGREISGSEARACFQCHATGVAAEGSLQLEALIPGVQCEHCHVGASRHLQAISHGQRDPLPAKLGRLASEDLSNFCGQCHRSWAEVVRGRLFGPMNARFQPYRLASSKCFDGSDRRISCVACHDPHRELVVDDKSYETKCLACHGPAAVKTAGAKSCHVASTGCVGCHMPKTQLPGGHQIFTDHYIRIVRPNEPYPN